MNKEQQNIMKKEREFRCLDMIIKDKNTTGPFANKIQFLLKNMVDYKIESESPDFILQHEDCCVGLEHCLTDSLFNKSNNSYVRNFDTDCTHTIENYQNNQNLNEGMENVQKMMKNRFDALYNFNYDLFINNFRKIFVKHSNKVEKYKNNLSKYNCDYKLIGCIIEIPCCENASDFKLKKDNRIFKQRLSKFPITKSMIEIIRCNSKFDFVIICSYYKNNNQIIYLSCNDIYNSIKEQNIQLYDEFDYSFKVKISDIKFRDDGEKIDLLASADLFI